MKYFTLTLLTFLFINIISAQVSKTYVKTFKLDGDSFVSIQVDGPVILEKWKNEKLLRVHTSVELENASPKALKFFLIQNRYDLRGIHENGTLKINSFPRTKDVEYSGQKLEETVEYKIYVPENIEVRIIDPDMPVNAVESFKK